METVVMLFYVLFGVGCRLGFYPQKELTLLDIPEILLWPITLGTMVTASLKKYLEIE